MKEESIFLWWERIANKEASGLKLNVWCVQNQVTTHSYYYWKRKIADLDCNEMDSPLFVEIPNATLEHTSKWREPGN